MATRDELWTVSQYKIEAATVVSVLRAQPQPNHSAMCRSCVLTAGLLGALRTSRYASLLMLASAFWRSGRQHR